MKKLLEVEHLSVEYVTYAGRVRSVRDISFKLEDGKTTAFVGESGCGKSVTAKTLMGLIEKPGKVSEESQIIFKGENIEGYTQKQWNKFRGKNCSMIFQDALVSLNPTMKIGKQMIENLKNHEEYKNLSQAKMNQKAEEFLKMTGIPDVKSCMKKYPHELSGGMRQRVMIAAAMITNPEILIADEPTTALDVTIQEQILELMKNLQKKFGMAIVMITHDLGVVADMADQIIVMYAGKIVERGSCDDIFYEPKHPYTWSLLKSIPHIDQKEKTPLLSIEGELPDMTDPPKGCAFCDRCPCAMNICRMYDPNEKDFGNGHKAACWLLDERAKKIGGCLA